MIVEIAKVKGYTGDAELGDALKGADVVVIPGLNKFFMLNFPKKKKIFWFLWFF